MLTFLLVSLNFYLVSSNSFLRTGNCQSGCHPLDETKINVHLVPHSHDDVGWLKTYQQYYEGSGKFDRQDNAGVKYILDSTVKALSENANRRFIQVETAFFWKWWNDQTNQTRSLVKNMVNKGQLEMINGGWSMNDEAATNYQSIIDQFTWGFRILEETVGECGRPKIGWQIDPFGHSREHASLLKQFGFEGLVVGRIDFRDKEQRIADRNLDFIWNTNDNFNETNAELFTTMFPDFYVSEKGFCFDVLCDDPEITDSNLRGRVAEFTKRLEKYKEYYQTKNILLPMGQDFSYQKAEKNYNNIDKLIEGFKDNEMYNVMYSTPSCYIQAVKIEVANNNIKLTTKTDDFFPHASDSHSFWTGYFTSRPTSKRMERVGNNILQSAKQLTTFSRIMDYDNDADIFKLRTAMAVMQHHDAITGTEKQAVANNYHTILNQGIEEAGKVMSDIITYLLKKTTETDIDLNFSNCLLANMSICETTKKDRFLVAVQNPLSKVVSHYVRVPVDGESYKITGPEEDAEIKFDIFDTLHTFDFVTNAEPATKELVFLATDLPPLGVKLYYVEKVEGKSDAYHRLQNLTDDRLFGTKINGFTIGTDGKLETVTIKEQTQNIKQEFLYYNGLSGSNFDAENRASGAYIFRPNGSAIPVSDNVTELKFARGTLADEVVQVVNDEITQIIRIYKEVDDTYIEFDWLVGDLKVGTYGKEIITRFTVQNLQNDGIFYTDSNGRQQIKRTRNTRSDYNFTSEEEPVSSNYYPVTSRVVIKGKNLEFAVLNDRSQGGSSLEDGQVELMIHRRAIDDDGFGVSEKLNEEQYGKGLYARGHHYVTFGTLEDNPTVFERDLAHRKLLAPLILTADATDEALSLDKVQDLFKFKFEGLRTSLPNNVQILTLEPWKDSYILRLEHIFEKEEDVDLSKEVTVDLTELFPLFNITELTPVKLGANEHLEATTADNFIQRYIRAMKAGDDVLDLKVTLQPMEIKTFLFKTNQNNIGGHDVGISEGTSGAPSLSSLFLVIASMSSLCLLYNSIGFHT